MVLKLKQIFEIAGEKKVFEYDIPVEDLKPYERYSFVTPIAIKGRIENHAGIVTLNFSTDFTMKLNCDRCLCEFERKFSYDFEHILVRKLNTDNDEYIVCSDDTLDLNELAISNIILQLPSKILCKEDCKGLCCICGNNNNISQCSCKNNSSK